MTSEMTAQRRRPAKVLGRGGLYVGAAVIALVCGFPLYWMVLTSVKPSEEVFSSPPVFWPSEVTLDAYRRLIETTEFTTHIFNSFVVATGATLLAVGTATLAAYAFTRFRFFGRELLAKSTLFAYCFAPIVIVVPLYAIFRDVGLTNSRLGLVIAYASFGLPFSLWLLRSFFEGIPIDLEEAALVDGASRPRAVWHILVPLALPGVIAISVFTFILAWNDFIFAKILISDSSLKTVPVGLHDLFQATLLDWQLIMAGAVLVSVPVIVGLLFIQRFLIAGWGAGGVKG